MKLKHFKIDEFKCPCCGENHINNILLISLDKARDIAGIPFIITSGYRCPKHNKEVGGKPNSAHLKGLAVDIKATSSKQRFLITQALIKAGFTRIGIAHNFIHADIDSSKPQKVIWLYY